MSMRSRRHTLLTHRILYIHIDGSIYVGGNLKTGENLYIGGAEQIAISGQTYITDSSDSTSTVTGALLVAGGAGLGGGVYIYGRQFENRWKLVYRRHRANSYSGSNIYYGFIRLYIHIDGSDIGGRWSWT